ncbi:MAG: hypothetical protein JST50_11565 [Bacteroidetes bacterium]|jgi:hypothetical protein|nr:hypothetical protein [Bacteroidota bacterium]
MKTLVKIGMIATLGSSLFLTSCAGEYYVSDQPADVYYDPGPPPYSGAVWLEGDWVYSGGHYVHNRGHWARGRANRTWVKGNWDHNNRGYKWHRGHWQ